MKQREYPAREPERPPTHPGEILSEDFLPALGLSVAVAAQKLGVTRQAVHRIVHAQAAISPEMAMRLGKLCGNGPEIWLNLQRNYDLWHLRRKLAAELERIPTLAER